ncbi:hypothetical protein DSO57_1007671 [Entomophthora muscae]|uniref:Uncharacterized protein n=1 Tax=Entomophthora muscae TaxID=34485 RepID=A0ACC2T753_9FUNG|nr:hypothetical protein DSO57_1007671 [Entomophthora muscae]
MEIGTGWREDPKELPGISSLCNRFIFDKNVSESMSFRQYIASNRGDVYATNEYERTEVSYQVPNKELDLSLERSSELFVNPSFDDKLARERVEVVNENLKISQNGPASYVQAAKAALNSTHKYASFQFRPLDPKALNSTTLLNFFNKHYSADLMALAVLGNADMETLKKLVIPRFSKIKTSDLETITSGFPYNKQNQGKHIKIDSSPDGDRKLTIEFGLGPLTDESYMQLRFIGFLFKASKTNSLSKMLIS